MKSETLPSFWKAYYSLEQVIRYQARKVFRLWKTNPFHPSLHFKCINPIENIWSVRITRGYRALSIVEDNIVTWFWIGNHSQYERFFLS